MLLDFAAMRIPWLNAWRKRTANEYRQRGWDAYGKGYYDGALAYLNTARELMPREPTIHCDLGEVYYAQGRHLDAEQCFREALKWDFDYLRALEWMGYTLRERGNFAEAVYFFLRYLAHDPKNSKVLLNLGASLHDAGKFEEAITYYKKAEALDPQNPLILENRARAYYALGQVDEAIKHIRRSLTLNRSNSRAEAFLGLALQTNGESEEALKSYQRAIQLDPENASVKLDMSVLLDRLGRYREGAEYARQAIEIYEKQADMSGLARVYWNLGWLYYRMGQLEESVQASRKSVEVDPSLFGARFNLGLALLQQGRVEEARKEYLQGADSVKLASHLKTSAIEDLEEALRVQPLPGGAEILKELQAKYQTMRSKRGLIRIIHVFQIHEKPPSGKKLLRRSLETTQEAFA
jgi:tetratricopeptide (TPR) repeat protein